MSSRSLKRWSATSPTASSSSVAPVLALTVAPPAHYPNHLDTIGHLGLIYPATLIFVVGALLSLKSLLVDRNKTAET
jgi:hypothetical protein